MLFIHLDCFHLLVIMNSAAANTVYKFHVDIMFSFLLGLRLAVELLSLNGGLLNLIFTNKT